MKEPKTPATSIEQQIITALHRCTFLPGSFDKRFAQNTFATGITAKQRWWLHFIGYKYRKQIANKNLEIICKAYIDKTVQP